MRIPTSVVATAEWEEREGRLPGIVDVCLKPTIKTPYVDWISITLLCLLISACLPTAFLVPLAMGQNY